MGKSWNFGQQVMEKALEKAAMKLGGEPQRPGTGTTTRPGRVQPTQFLQDPCERAKAGEEATHSLKVHSSSKRGSSSLEKDTEPEQAPAEEGAQQ